MVCSKTTPELVASSAQIPLAVAPMAQAPTAIAPRDSAAILRAPRMAIVGLPLSLLTLWLAVLAGGRGGVDALGNPLGGDFAMFYIAGQMAYSGEWTELYDESLQQRRLLEQLPGLSSDTYLPYRYPPLVAIFASPLAALPYRVAFAVFSLVSLGLWLGSIRLLTRDMMPKLDAYGSTAGLAVACAPVAVQTIIDGQASLIWFAIAAVSWWCLQRGHQVSAGALLALAACKPNVMLLLAVVLFLRYPRMLWGWIPAGLVMFLTTVAVAGAEPLVAYADLGKQLAWKPWLVETPYWKVQSLLHWTEPVLGSSARRVNMLIGFAAAVCIGGAWRRRLGVFAVDAWALCAALVVNALFNPYTPVYDMTLLCLGLLAVCAWAASQNALPECLARRDVQCTGGLVLLGPVVSQALAKFAECPLQFMPLGLLAAGVYWLAKPLFGHSPKRCEITA